MAERVEQDLKESVGLFSRNQRKVAKENYEVNVRLAQQLRWSILLDRLYRCTRTQLRQVDPKTLVSNSSSI